MKKLVLASASPRRRELLGWLGLEFEVVEPEFNEELVEVDDPEELVAVLAVEKAKEVVERKRGEWLEFGALVLGADTVVVSEEGEALGKPRSDDEAIEMLEKLRGREHRVLTGVAVMDVDTDEVLVEVEETGVEMREFSDKELMEYVASGEPRGKAGGYAIQGRGRRLVRGVRGSFTNVVGLPVKRVREMLALMGVEVSEGVERVVIELTGFRD